MKLLVTALHLMIACQASAFAAEPIRIHNGAEVFLHFWDRYQDRPLEHQVQAFKDEVAPSFPQYYAYKFEKWKSQGENPDEMLAANLRRFPGIEAKFREKNRELPAALEANARAFSAHFPDFSTDFDLYIIHSLGEMDGGTRTLEGKSHFIFGIDNMIKYHRGGTAPIFFSHELFHKYHEQHFQNPHKMWGALWAEGLATYVSARLNPQASLKDVVMDVPMGMLEKTQADMPYLWAKMKANLDSESEELYESFFLINKKQQRIPGRAGYYLGYLVAEELGRTKSLHELARLNGPVLRAEIDAAISRLAK